MKQVTATPTVFKQSMEKTSENTVVFENCTTFEKYNSPNEKYTNVLNLCVQNNYILNEIIPYLKTIADVKLYDEEVAKEYYGKPMKLSMYYYGVIDYWWIILAMNNYFVSRDFVGWTRLLIPSKAQIEQIIDKALYSNSDIGKFI
jgi:hypothetical protein